MQGSLVPGSWIANTVEGAMKMGILDGVHDFTQRDRQPVTDLEMLRKLSSGRRDRMFSVRIGRGPNEANFQSGTVEQHANGKFFFTPAGQAASAYEIVKDTVMEGKPGAANPKQTLLVSYQPYMTRARSELDAARIDRNPGPPPAMLELTLAPLSHNTVIRNALKNILPYTASNFLNTNYFANEDDLIEKIGLEKDKFQRLVLKSNHWAESTYKEIRLPESSFQGYWTRNGGGEAQDKHYREPQFNLFAALMRLIPNPHKLNLCLDAKCTNNIKRSVKAWALSNPAHDRRRVTYLTTPEGLLDPAPKSELPIMREWGNISFRKTSQPSEYESFDNLQVNDPEATQLLPPPPQLLNKLDAYEIVRSLPNVKAYAVAKYGVTIYYGSWGDGIGILREGGSVWIVDKMFCQKSGVFNHTKLVSNLDLETATTAVADAMNPTNDRGKTLKKSRLTAQLPVEGGVVSHKRLDVTIPFKDKPLHLFAKKSGDTYQSNYAADSRHGNTALITMDRVLLCIAMSMRVPFIIFDNSFSKDLFDTKSRKRLPHGPPPYGCTYSVFYRQSAVSPFALLMDTARFAIAEATDNISWLSAQSTVSDRLKALYTRVFASPIGLAMIDLLTRLNGNAEGISEPTMRATCNRDWRVLVYIIYLCDTAFVQLDKIADGIRAVNAEEYKPNLEKFKYELERVVHTRNMALAPARAMADIQGPLADCQRYLEEVKAYKSTVNLLNSLEHELKEEEVHYGDQPYSAAVTMARFTSDRPNSWTRVYAYCLANIGRDIDIATGYPFINNQRLRYSQDLLATLMIFNGHGRIFSPSGLPRTTPLSYGLLDTINSDENVPQYWHGRFEDLPITETVAQASTTQVATLSRQQTLSDGYLIDMDSLRVPASLYLESQDLRRSSRSSSQANHAAPGSAYPLVKLHLHLEHCPEQNQEIILLKNAFISTLLTRCSTDIELYRRILPTLGASFLGKKKEPLPPEAATMRDYQILHWLESSGGRQHARYFNQALTLMEGTDKESQDRKKYRRAMEEEFRDLYDKHGYHINQLNARRVVATLLQRVMRKLPGFTLPSVGGAQLSHGDASVSGYQERGKIAESNLSRAEEFRMGVGKAQEEEPDIGEADEVGTGILSAEKEASGVKGSDENRMELWSSLMIDYYNRDSEQLAKLSKKAALSLMDDNNDFSDMERSRINQILFNSIDYNDLFLAFKKRNGEVEEWYSSLKSETFVPAPIYDFTAKCLRFVIQIYDLIATVDEEKIVDFYKESPLIQILSENCVYTNYPYACVYYTQNSIIPYAAPTEPDELAGKMYFPNCLITSHVFHIYEKQTLRQFAPSLLIYVLLFENTYQASRSFIHSIIDTEKPAAAGDDVSGVTVGQTELEVAPSSGDLESTHSNEKAEQVNAEVARPKISDEIEELFGGKVRARSSYRKRRRRRPKQKTRRKQKKKPMRKPRGRRRRSRRRKHTWYTKTLKNQP